MLTVLLFLIFFIILFVEKKYYGKEYPYEFNYNKEYKLYKNVGKKWRKKLSNKRGCNTYIEWKDEFQNKYLKRFEKNPHNILNFEKYLKKRLKISNVTYEAIKVIECPVFIAEITIGLENLFDTTSAGEMLYGVIGMIDILTITLFAAIFLLDKHYTKICFYEDCIEIVEEFSESIKELDEGKVRNDFVE